MNAFSAVPEWIVIDWGTTNFRAFLMDSNNQCLDRIERETGLLNVKDRAFEQVLHTNIKPWLEQNATLPIFMAGMIGSKQGWHEASYIETPVYLETLGDTCLSFETQWGSTVRIVPGVCHHVDKNKFDVMRGEEVQILGLIQLGYQQDCFAILPGTHSKHAHISGRELSSFSTFMTGEFFALLSEHSILGKNLRKQLSSPSAFKKGVHDGCNGNLMNTAFMARTNRLFDQLEESEVHDYLSGLLIGKEVSGIDTTCYVISSEKLGERYAMACQLLDKPATIINGDDCFIAGMTALKEQILCPTH